MPSFTQSRTALDVHSAMHFLSVKAGIQEHPRFPIAVHPGMGSLPEDSPARLLYPIDFLPGGGNILLPWGVVQYWVLGPTNGQKVVITHGISSAAVVWKDLATLLASKGFRVLVYDLYGMGYSEAPQVSYDANLFLAQLSMLLQYLRWDDVYLVGSSMGGAITAAFAAIFPWLVKDKLVLISCAGLVKDHPKKKKQAKPPQAVANTSLLTELRNAQSKALDGYETAIHSCTENGPVRGLESTFDALGQSDLSVLAIHGSADKRVPLQYAHELKQRIPQAELVVLEEAGHDLMSEERFMHQANDLIASFLSGPVERQFVYSKL